MPVEDAEIDANPPVIFFGLLVEVTENFNAPAGLSLLLLLLLL